MKTVPDTAKSGRCGEQKGHEQAAQPGGASAALACGGAVGAVVGDQLAVADQHGEHLADGVAQQRSQLALPLGVLSN